MRLENRGGRGDLPYLIGFTKYASEPLLDGMLTVRDANRRLGLGLPENEHYMTIAGFLLAQAGRLIGPGEVIKYEDALFTVESMAGRRILRVRYTPGGAGKESMERSPSAKVTEP